MIRHLAVGLLLVLSLAGASPPPEIAIAIDNFSFSMADLTIPVGTKVVWTNRDDIPHTVTSDSSPRLFKSPPLDTDDAFSYMFTTPGTYAYFCSLHPHMTAKIIVR
jgi:plastocyanin